MRLTLVINALSAGGAERVLTDLANHFAGKGWSINLLTFDDGSMRPFFALDNRVDHSPLSISTSGLSLQFKLVRVFKSLWSIRKALTKIEPDLVLSFMDQANLLTVVSSVGLGIPVIVSERVYPSFSSLAGPTASPLMRKIFPFVRNMVYRLAAQIVVQTERACNYFPPAIRAKTVVIPNPAPIKPDSLESAPLQRPAIIGIGRFTGQKRFDLLIEAFSKIEAEIPEWTLTIIGDGPERGDLLRRSEQLRQQGRVKLPGLVNSSAFRFVADDIYVLCSDYEGFPGALLEAMVAGAAVVATDCPAGPAEMIRNGECGILVPCGDTVSIAAAIKRLCQDDALRRRLGGNAKQSSNSYSPSCVFNIWQNLFSQMKSAKRRVL